MCDERVKELAEQSIRNSLPVNGLEGTLETIERVYSDGKLKSTMIDVFWERIINKK